MGVGLFLWENYPFIKKRAVATPLVNTFFETRIISAEVIVVRAQGKEGRDFLKWPVPLLLILL